MLVSMPSCFLIFQRRLPSQNFLYDCLSWKSVVWVDNSREWLKTHIFSQVSLNWLGVLQPSRLRCCAVSPFFLKTKVTLCRKKLLNSHAVTQNYVFASILSEAKKNDSRDHLIRHVKEIVVMKNNRQFRKNCHLPGINVWLYDWDL